MSEASHDHGHGHGHSPFIQHHFDDAQHQFDSGKLGIWLFLVTEILFFSGLFVAYIVYRTYHPEIFKYAHSYLDTKMGAINTGVLILSSLTAAWAVRAAQLNKQKLLIGCLAVTILCAFGFLGIKYMEYAHKFHVGTVYGKHFDPCEAPDGTALPCKKWKKKDAKLAAAVDKGSKPDKFIADANKAIAKAEKELAAAKTPDAKKAAQGKVAAAKNELEALQKELPGLKASLAANQAALKEHRKVVPEGGWDALPADKIPPRNTNMFFSIYFGMTGLHGIHVLLGALVFIWLLVRAIKGHFTPEYFGPVDYAALYWHLVDLIWIYLFPLLYLIH
jgi:cytochrome c oxidase subunit 3